MPQLRGMWKACKLLNTTYAGLWKLVDLGALEEPFRAGGKLKFFLHHLEECKEEESAWRDSVPYLLSELAVPTTPLRDVLLPLELEEVRPRLREHHCHGQFCIYLLFRGSKVVYVGQSAEMGGRIDRHWKGTTNDRPKLFDRVLYFTAKEEELCKEENRLIKLLKPEYNRVANRT
jgi:hypothetical protein